MRNQPSVAITIGDPAGVGPEVTVKALSDPEVASLARWIVVGSRAVTEDAARQFQCELPRSVLWEDIGEPRPGEFEIGNVSAKCGAAAVKAIQRAAEMCLDGRADAMTTAPVNKEAVALSGVPFTGHTEYIAQATGATESRMLLVNERLAVVHVTTHVALRKACEATEQRVLRTLELGHEAMVRMGRGEQQIAVCGLNPHAGEHGMFGAEEQQVVEPAIAAARVKGIPCSGPYPADTIFLRASNGEFGMVVAMYHDQGHIPMKLLDFSSTVNVSLGLPIIRTSVDHGTAMDIAGRGVADPNNMKAALKLAARMAGG
jgi:4-hydroxythreonine-4-phosphate dehydrogenase